MENVLPGLAGAPLRGATNGNNNGNDNSNANTCVVQRSNGWVNVPVNSPAYRRARAEQEATEYKLWFYRTYGPLWKGTRESLIAYADALVRPYDESALPSNHGNQAPVPTSSASPVPQRSTLNAAAPAFVSNRGLPTEVYAAVPVFRTPTSGVGYVLIRDWSADGRLAGILIPESDSRNLAAVDLMDGIRYELVSLSPEEWYTNEQLQEEEDRTESMWRMIFQ